jgi:hypothetical protein
MVRHKPDREPDISGDLAKDRGESPDDMEPLLIGETSRFRGSLTDLAVELAQKAAGFRRSLPVSLVKSLANLVRSMNCYYSNLIEGHYTHPIDIERALKNDYSKDARKRDLQLEAKAHVGVQKWIDKGGLKERAVTTEGIREIHRRFCAELPEALLWVEDPEGKERVRVVPGELRTRDVKVGGHFAISPGAAPRFLKRFAVGEAFDIPLPDNRFRLDARYRGACRCADDSGWQWFELHARTVRAVPAYRQDG